MTYIDYKTRIERCKREDTKESMIICLDNVSIDNNEQIQNEFIDAFELVGIIFIIIFVGIFIGKKVFG